MLLSCSIGCLPCVLGQHVWVKSSTSFVSLLYSSKHNLPHDPIFSMSLPLTPCSIWLLKMLLCATERVACFTSQQRVRLHLRLNSTASSAHVKAMRSHAAGQLVMKVMCRSTFFSLPTTGVESSFCTA